MARLAKECDNGLLKLLATLPILNQGQGEAISASRAATDACVSFNSIPKDAACVSCLVCCTILRTERAIPSVRTESLQRPANPSSRRARIGAGEHSDGNSLLHSQELRLFLGMAPFKRMWTAGPVHCGLGIRPNHPGRLQDWFKFAAESSGPAKFSPRYSIYLDLYTFYIHDISLAS